MYPPTGSQSPETSGLPSAVFGAGAVRSGLPSGVLGIPAVGYFNHCAESEAHVSKIKAACCVSFMLGRLYNRIEIHGILTRDGELAC